jgi:hypothetical protein
VQRGQIAELVAAAQRQDECIRLHLRDGEVVTARVLGWDGEALVYAPLTSSRPERYALCDATGYSVALESIERAALLTRNPRR